MAKILVIEDEKDLQAVIEIMLTTDGHEVVVVGDANSGWEKLEEINPDLVICDFCLPHGFIKKETAASEGSSLIASINEEYPELPVIGMSALVSKDRVIKQSVYKVSTMLEKPFDKDQMLKAVADALG